MKKFYLIALWLMIAAACDAQEPAESSDSKVVSGVFMLYGSAAFLGELSGTGDAPYHEACLQVGPSEAALVHLGGQTVSIRVENSASGAKLHFPGRSLKAIIKHKKDIDTGGTYRAINFCENEDCSSTLASLHGYEKETIGECRKSLAESHEQYEYMEKGSPSPDEIEAGYQDSKS